MKKILLIGNNATGLYKFRNELIQRLLTEGYEVFISTPYNDYIPLLQKMGCTYIKLEYNASGKNPQQELKLIHDYYQRIKQCGCDIALLYTIKPTLYAGLACRRLNIPYIANITGLSPVLSEPGILKNICFFLYKFVLKHANMVFFQNQSNMNLFVKKNVVNDRIKLIPGSGVNLQEHKYENYVEDGTLRILYVGRIVKVKGIDELLEAIKILNNKYNDLIFEMVGSCDNNYQEKINILHNKKQITYYGTSMNPHEYMKKAQAVIMPSYSEGMSNVLLEASACGRPILASDVQGCREIVMDGVTGLKFEPHNVNSIVDAVEKFRNLSKEQRERMGIEGRKHVENNFSRDIVINAYMNEIEKICEET